MTLNARQDAAPEYQAPIPSNPERRGRLPSIGARCARPRSHVAPAAIASQAHTVRRLASPVRLASLPCLHEGASLVRQATVGQHQPSHGLVGIGHLGLRQRRLNIGKRAQRNTKAVGVIAKGLCGGHGLQRHDFARHDADGLARGAADQVFADLMAVVVEVKQSGLFRPSFEAVDTTIGERDHRSMGLRHRQCGEDKRVGVLGADRVGHFASPCFDIPNIGPLALYVKRPPALFSARLTHQEETQ